MVSGLGSIPLSDRLLSFSVDSSSLLMALVMDVVVMSYRGISRRLVVEARARACPLLKGILFGEDIDTHNLTRLGLVTIFTRHTLGSFLFFNTFHHLHEFVYIAFLLEPHLGSHLCFLGPESLLFVLFVDDGLQSCAHL